MMIVLVDKNGILQGEGYYMFMYMQVDILYMSISLYIQVGIRLLGHLLKNIQAIEWFNHQEK